MANINPILNTDSYKFSHYLQYPDDVKYINAYVEARGGLWNKTLFYGLQVYLMEYLTQKVTKEHIEEARDFVKNHGLPFNEDGWKYIVDAHGGVLPVEIEAVAEGSLVGTGNVLLQIKNTDPKVPWITTYLETGLLRAIWYPTTIATNSYHCKHVIHKYLEETGDPSIIDFMLHDFGGRGANSFESAGLGASAHLLNFKGTDTFTGIVFADKYYKGGVCGLSVPASEHSSIISWKKDQEYEAYKNMVNRFGHRVFACVIDSYDVFNAINMWTDKKENGQSLVDLVEQRGGRVILRPDSGNPITMINECLELLFKKVGFSLNSKGYRVLPDHIRLIYGDHMNVKNINNILKGLQDKLISADNIAFGMGGALLQDFNRDDLSFAMKVNCISNDNVNWIGVNKEPVIDKTKKSKSGMLALIKENDIYKTIEYGGDLKHYQNKLVKVFRNGEILKYTTFDEIRKNINF